MAMFDKASGVVYTETTSAQLRTMVPTWMSQARGKRDKTSALRSRGKGCSSLQDMVLRSCAFHAELFEPAALQWAGWHYAKRIYQHLVNTEALTYNAWNIILDAYPNEINSQQQFHVYQGDESYQPTQFFSITNRLAKLPTSFVTLLCIRDFSLTFDHLKALVNIPTLAAMILEQARPGGRSEITARHFLDFGRAVREKNALTKLRLLIMCDFGLGRTAILDGVAGFPALQLVGMQNSKTSVMADLEYCTYGDGNFTTLSELQKRGLSCARIDPQSIWTSSFMTSSRKMQELYDLTTTLAQPSDSHHRDDRSVSLTYGGWANRSIYEATTWFMRDPLAPTRKPAEVKQPVSASRGIEGSATKKRKIRTGKQVDLGCFLGAFK